jgi:peptidoglycan/xylan/chitin deacetylase (PgdA/CDA1 family)
MIKRAALIIFAVSIFILSSTAVIAFAQPSWVFMFLERRSSDVLYSIETQDPIVALTIDDGPDPTTTPTILEVLEEHDAQATFFLISRNIEGNEDLVQRIVDEGHEIGNHLTSERPSILYSSTEFEAELIEAHEALSRFSQLRWFRPGSGWYNNAMLDILAKYGYQCALGSVYPFDAEVPSSQFASRYVLWRVSPGAIILLHDNDGRGQRTAETLSMILPELKAQGIRVTTLSELVAHSE